MLVLTRRPKERIVIGDQIDVTVLSVQGNRVRIGIEAPLDVSVTRPEVQQRKLAELAMVSDRNGGSLSPSPDESKCVEQTDDHRNQCLP